VWFRRGRLLMVSPDKMGTACPLSGRNSTYRPVQISGTGSEHAPKGTTRKQVNEPLTKIRLLRNRIAHHEPILRFNLPQRHEQTLELTKWLSPTAAEWAKRHSRFYEIYDDKLAALFRT